MEFCQDRAAAVCGKPLMEPAKCCRDMRCCSGYFPCPESLHHIRGQGHGVAACGQVAAVQPQGLGQLVRFQLDRVAALQIGKKAQGKIPVDSPGLAAVLADMLYPQADLFPHFTAYSIFGRFADFTKTGY